MRNTVNLRLDCQLAFGTYVQTHEEHDNSMQSQTTGAIALRPSGNLQGGYYFMSLTTGKRLARDHWTVLPMPNEVIAAVEAMAGTQGANDTLDMSLGDEAPTDTIDANMGGEDDFILAPTGVNAPQQIQQQLQQQPANMNPFAPLYAEDDDDDDPAEAGDPAAMDDPPEQVPHIDEIITMANNVENVLNELMELGERTKSIVNPGGKMVRPSTEYTSFDLNFV
jgi:hypothetical protein